MDTDSLEKHLSVCNSRPKEKPLVYKNRKNIPRKEINAVPVKSEPIDPEVLANFFAARPPIQKIPWYLESTVVEKLGKASRHTCQKV